MAYRPGGLVYGPPAACRCVCVCVGGGPGAVQEPAGWPRPGGLVYGPPAACRCVCVWGGGCPGASWVAQTRRASIRSSRRLPLCVCVGGLSRSQLGWEGVP